MKKSVLNDLVYFIHLSIFGFYLVHLLISGIIIFIYKKSKRQKHSRPIYLLRRANFY